MTASLKDTYLIQKLALTPLTGSVSPAKFRTHLLHLEPEVRARLAAFIETNSLGPMWLKSIDHHTIEEVWSHEWREKLQRQYQQITMLYMQQLRTVKSVSLALEGYGIEHAVFKGVHTRELVYPQPAARYAADIDILIPERQRATAVDLLEKKDFKLNAPPTNRSHELSLSRKYLHIDLHWHIMRPGRIPMSLTDELLERREKLVDYWALEENDHLYILLIHSLFTKYPALTTSGIIRNLDLLLWLRQRQVDWRYVEERLKKTGSMSAAWITLEYLNKFTDDPPAEFASRLSPSSLKRWYLQQWIDRDWPTRLYKAPLISKFLFTLFGHDTFKDVFAFLQTYMSVRFRSRI